MIYALMDGEKIIRTQHFPSTPEDPCWVEYDEPPRVLTREEKKDIRQSLVDSIIVEVNGKKFDGDETSQNRMSRAILTLKALNAPNVNWTLADNTEESVTVEELVQALAMSGMEQVRVWSIE